MHREEAAGLRLVGHSNLGGFGDGMQVMRHEDALYVAHLGTSGRGTSILDVSDVTSPQLVRQWDPPAGTHTHKVQVADGILLINHERFRSQSWESAGMAVYDLTDPLDPHQIGFWDSTGDGVHRIVWEGGKYAYVSATPDGFDDRILVIVDLSDPQHPVEVARWWWPGMWTGGGETPDWPSDETRNVHHALVNEDRAYVGLWDSGMVILDISDAARPTTVSRLSWEVGGRTHTCLPLPGRELVIVTDEAVEGGDDRSPHMVRVVDVSDEEHPVVVAICPVPAGDFSGRGLRFGAHCLHENRPDSYRSEEVAFVTYFNAGLRVYDLANAQEPKEIAYWIPEGPPGQEAAQINDVWVGQDKLVYVTDRISGGVYILEPDSELTARMEQASV